jgi:hypothetical protein
LLVDLCTACSLLKHGSESVKDVAGYLCASARSEYLLFLGVFMGRENFLHSAYHGPRPLRSCSSLTVRKRKTRAARCIPGQVPALYID